MARHRDGAHGRRGATHGVPRVRGRHTRPRARVRVVRARAEVAGRDAALRGRFDVVVARGFGPPAVTAECAAPLLSLGGGCWSATPLWTASAHAQHRREKGGARRAGPAIVGRRRISVCWGSRSRAHGPRPTTIDRSCSPARVPTGSPVGTACPPSDRCSDRRLLVASGRPMGLLPPDVPFHVEHPPALLTRLASTRTPGCLGCGRVPAQAVENEQRQPWPGTMPRHQAC